MALCRDSAARRPSAPLSTARYGRPWCARASSSAAPDDIAASVAVLLLRNYVVHLVGPPYASRRDRYGSGGQVVSAKRVQIWVRSLAASCLAYRAS